MKNPFYKKAKAIERTEKEPTIYIFTGEQLFGYSLFLAVVGGLIIKFLFS